MRARMYYWQLGRTRCFWRMVLAARIMFLVGCVVAGLLLVHPIDMRLPHD
jgi:hypothetical protein